MTTKSNTNMHSTKIQSGFGFFDLETGDLVAYGSRRNTREIRNSMNNPERYSGVRKITLKVSTSVTI